MKFKKVLSAVLVAATCVSLCACGGGKKDGGSDGGDGAIQVAIWDNIQLDGLKEIAAGFTEETGVDVEFQVVPWNEYWTLLEAGATGGEMPDVFWMHSTYSQRYMSNDILLDLTDKIESSEKVNLDNYYKDIAELYQYDGKTYAIPKDYDTIALWYNKKCLTMQVLLIRMRHGHGRHLQMQPKSLQRRTEVSTVRRFRQLLIRTDIIT